MLWYQPVKEFCVDSRYRSSSLTTDFHTYANPKAWKKHKRTVYLMKIMNGKY